MEPRGDTAEVDLDAMARGLVAASGRSEGWLVRHEGRPVAELTDCRFADMFWDSYRLEELPLALELELELSDPSTWFLENLTFETRATHQLATGAFPSPRRPGDRIHFRRLYLTTERLTRLQRIEVRLRVVWIRLFG